MPGEKEDAEPVDHEHRERLTAARELLEHLGVPGVRISGRPQRLLVDRGGGDRVDLAGLGEAYRALHRLPGGAAGAGLHRAHAERRRIHVGEIEHVDDAVGEPPLPGARHRGSGGRGAEGAPRARNRLEVADDQRPAHRVERGRGQGLDDDLRADPGGVAHRHGDDGPRARAGPLPRRARCHGRHPAGSAGRASSRNTGRSAS